MKGTVNLRGKQYKTVALRVAEFRANFPDYGILTEVVSANERSVIMRAEVRNETGVTVATGHAEEVRTATGVNSTSALENAETSAIGRALACLGLGGEEYASAEELARVSAMEDAGELEAVLNAINDAETLDALRAIVNRHGKGPNAAAIIAAASARKLAIKPADLPAGGAK